MRKLNILVVPPNNLLRHPIPNRIYHISKRLACHHNIFLVSYSHYPLAEAEPVRALKCDEIKIEPIIRTESVGSYYLASAPHLYRELSNVLRRNAIDVIFHANIIPSYIASRAGKRSQIPLLYDYVDHFPESASAYFNNSIVSTFVKELVSRIVRENLRSSNYVTTPSYTLASEIRRMCQIKKLSVIPNGVDADLFRPIPQGISAETLGVGDRFPIILYFGSLDQWMDFEALIVGTKAVRVKYQKVLLVIMGVAHNPSMLKAIKQTVSKNGMSENVLLLPPQPDWAVPKFVNASHLVIAPYKKLLKNAAMPLKIVEALACGKQVITSDTKEFRMWFENMPITYYNDVNDLGNLIISQLGLTDHQALVRSSEIVRSRFSWDNLSIEFENLLKSIVEE